MSRGDIVVAHQDETEVYVSEAGYVCIKQVGWDGEASVITLMPIHVPAVVKAMNDSIKEAQESRQLWLKEVDDDAS